MPGVRQWAVAVENQSDQPAVIFIGADFNFGDPNWQELGSVVPNTVAPRTRARVVMTLPAPGNWAVFVNPGPDRGPLLIPRDVPDDYSGELPGTIVVLANGQPTFQSMPFLPPGWCAEGSHMGCH